MTVVQYMVNIRMTWKPSEINRGVTVKKLAKRSFTCSSISLKALVNCNVHQNVAVNMICELPRHRRSLTVMTGTVLSVTKVGRLSVAPSATEYTTQCA